jgi:multidrug resistance efflux pump
MSELPTPEPRVSERPKLRADIIMKRHEGSTTAPFVAKDPQTRQFYRFRDAEHFIISQLDGQTPLDEVRRRVEERFGATLPEDTLTAFVERLQAYGLLESAGNPGPRASRSRLQGSLFLLRFKVFDPDRILSALAPRVGPLFSVPFLVATLALIALAAATTASNSLEIAGGLHHLFTFQALIVAWLVVFLVGGIHEFAHGLACKRFGGESHEIGVLLVYLMPGFYCDVSDAWLFPRRWQRLLVTAVGPYMDLVLWAAATVAWRLTNPGTVPNSLALIVLAATGLKVLVNLNPLLKLDGYYLLSDALGIPNLRARSFAYLKRLLVRRASSTPGPAISGREHAIYFTYGILAVVFSFGMLWIITMHLGEVLLPRFQGWGFLLLSILVIVRLRYRLLALAGKPTLRALAAKPLAAVRPLPARTAAGARAFLDRSPALRSWRPRSVSALRSRVEGTPVLRKLLDRWPVARTWLERATTIRPPDEPVTPRPPVRRWRAVGVLAAFVLFLMLVNIELRLSGEFRILPTLNADVRSEIEGLVSEVFVREGMAVKAGDLIARLADRDLLAELQKTEAAIAEKQAAMRMHEVELRRDETAMTAAEVRLHYRRNNLKRMQILRKADFIATKDLEQAEEDAAVREKELAVARLAMGSRREEILSAEAEIARLRAHARYLEEQQRLTSIHSRIDGVVTTPERHLRGLVGQNVKRGDLLASVHRLETVTAEIALSERDIGEIARGQYVAVKARAYPSVTFAGSVTAVAEMVRTPGGLVPGMVAPGVINAAMGAGPLPEEGGADRVVLVTTEIENGKRLLKPEMTGRAKIAVGQRSILSILTRRLARVIRVEFWSWW